MSYTFAYAAYLLPLFFLFLVLFWYLQKKQQKNLLDFAQAPTLEKILSPQSRFNFWIKASLFSLAWIFATFALMQPEGNPHYMTFKGETLRTRQVTPKLKRKPQQVFLFVDTSHSMLVADEANQMTRLQKAKDIGEAILSELQEEEVAIYTFNDQTAKLSPLTLDIIFPKIALNNISIGSKEKRGTNFKNLMTRINKELNDSAPLARKTAIIISDGEETEISRLPKIEQQGAITQLIDTVEWTKTKNSQLITIGVGSVGGGIVPNTTFDGKAVDSKLTPSLLQKLSQKGGGRYFQATDLSTLDLAKTITRKLKQKVSYYTPEEMNQLSTSSKPQLFYDRYFQYPLLLAILSILAILFVPDLRNKGWVIGLFLFTTLRATTPEEAALFYQAGDYPQAARLYQTLLDNSEEPWAKAVMQYNLANSLLKSNQWEEALANYNLISNQSPLLENRISFNKTLALLELAKAADNPMNRLLLLRQTEQALNEAKNKECLLQEIIGAETCQNDGQIILLSQQIDAELLKTASAFSSWQSEDLSLPLVGTLLSSHIKDMVTDIDFLIEQAAPLGKAEAYRDLFAHQAETWSLLIESLKTRYPEEMVILARRYYLLGLRQLKHNQYKMSKETFIAAEENLKLALEASVGKEKPQELLQSLAQAYRQVRLQEPLQLWSLETLKQLQLQLGEEKHLSFKRANLLLDEAIQSIKKREWWNGRLYTELAHQQVMSTIEADAEIKTPAELLRQLIQEQKLIISMHQIRNQLSGDSFNPEETESQHNVSEKAKNFFPFVLAHQEKEYFDHHYCQQFPWDQALPLFAAGLEAAKSARGKKNSLPLQNLALTKWKQALALLEKNKQRKEEEQHEKTINKMVQQLEEMEKKDHSAIQPVSIEEGLSW